MNEEVSLLCEYLHCGAFREEPLGMAWGPLRTPDRLLDFYDKDTWRLAELSRFSGLLRRKASRMMGLRGLYSPIDIL